MEVGSSRSREAEMKRASMASDDVIVAEERNVGEGASSESTGAAPSLVLSLGLKCSRVNANPLKHLASLLCEKLRAAGGGPCNLVQVRRTRIVSNYCVSP